MTLCAHASVSSEVMKMKPYFFGVSSAISIYVALSVLREVRTWNRFWFFRHQKASMALLGFLCCILIVGTSLFAYAALNGIDTSANRRYSERRFSFAKPSFGNALKIESNIKYIGLFRTHDIILILFLVRDPICGKMKCCAHCNFGCAI